jgi:DNA polymerase III epsilon subunit-like protein
MATEKHIWIDIETTGLKPENGAVIVSIGAVAELPGKKNAGKLAEFYGVICPTPEQMTYASPQAMHVNGFTWPSLQQVGKPFNDVMGEFCSWLVENGIDRKTHVLVGQNPKFDCGFLRTYAEDELRFCGFPLDEPINNIELYSILETRRVVPYLDWRKGNKKTSENVSKALGVEPEGFPHKALEGARAAMRNYLKLVELGARS